MICELPIAIILMMHIYVFDVCCIYSIIQPQGTGNLFRMTGVLLPCVLMQQLR